MLKVNQVVAITATMSILGEIGSRTRCKQSAADLIKTLDDAGASPELAGPVMIGGKQAKSVSQTQHFTKFHDEVKATRILRDLQGTRVIILDGRELQDWNSQFDNKPTVKLLMVTVQDYTPVQVKFPDVKAQESDEYKAALLAVEYTCLSSHKAVVNRTRQWVKRREFPVVGTVVLVTGSGAGDYYDIVEE